MGDFLRDPGDDAIVFLIQSFPVIYLCVLTSWLPTAIRRQDGDSNRKIPFLGRAKRDGLQRGL